MKKISRNGTKITSRRVKSFTGDRLEAYRKAAGLEEPSNSKGKSLPLLAAQTYSVSKAFEDQKKVDEKLAKQKLRMYFVIFMYNYMSETYFSRFRVSHS
jgi:hypothetical protein